MYVFSFSFTECKRINCTDFPADMTTKRPDTFTSTAQPDVSGYPPTPIELGEENKNTAQPSSSGADFTKQ